MIDRSYVSLMARYNHWQNMSLYREADHLGENERRMPRGAFFGSIHGTLSHLWWGDAMWLHRFSGSARPPGGIAASPALFNDWAGLRAARNELDDAILQWADSLDDAWLRGELSWTSSAANRVVSKPHWLLVTHFFNHQTHHRGQVHAMLTAAGGKPDATDIPFMPEA
jgi:uncharacterized damage-inducible protein DinB